MTNIGYCAFFGCEGLTSILVPNSVTSIGGQAFDGSINIADISVPESVINIGEDAFRGTLWYTLDGLIYIGRVLYAYKGEMPQNTNLMVKEGTISINSSALAGCLGLLSQSQIV